MSPSMSSLSAHHRNSGVHVKEIDFNGLRFNVPKTWTNQSTLVFAMPASDLAAPMAMQKQESHSTANVTVSWEAAGSLTSEDFLRQRMKTIPSIFPGFETMDEAYSAADLSFVQYRVPADTPFIQLVCAKRVGDQMACITGTALEPVFNTVKADFLATAESLSQSI